MINTEKNSNNVTPFRPLAGRPNARTARGSQTNSVERGKEAIGSPGFFAIDHRAFRKVCDIGLNEAVSYLIMARGTLKDNRTTSWSVNSIEERTNISRNRAKVAVENLLAQRFAEHQGGSAKRPRRRLVEAHLIGDAQSLPPLNEEEAAFFARLPVYTRPKLSDADKVAWQGLKKKGYARLRGTLIEATPETMAIDPRPDWVWLPNSLIDGIGEQDSPVEVLRQTQSVLVLKLMIDLYHVHALGFDGGIPKDMIWGEYTRSTSVSDNNFIAWSFKTNDVYDFSVNPNSSFYKAFLSHSPKNGNELFWEAIENLRKAGLLSFVPHLFESDKPDAEIICPIVEAVPGRDVTEAEALLYKAITSAGEKLSRAVRPSERSGPVFPVARHIKDVVCKSIVRLRHRPHTAVTSEWMTQSERWRQLADYWNSYAVQTPSLAA
nr:hypothetical protein [uncultured Novosphingobium sp.]